MTTYRLARLIVFEFTDENAFRRQMGQSMPDGVKVISCGTITIQTLDHPDPPDWLAEELEKARDTYEDYLDQRPASEREGYSSKTTNEQ